LSTATAIAATLLATTAWRSCLAALLWVILMLCLRLGRLRGVRSLRSRTWLVLRLHVTARSRPR
jgi:hypothetical protein